MPAPLTIPEPGAPHKANGRRSEETPPAVRGKFPRPYIICTLCEVFTRSQAPGFCGRFTLYSRPSHS